MNHRKHPVKWYYSGIILVHTRIKHTPLYDYSGSIYHKSPHVDYIGNATDVCMTDLLDFL
jgi:hypothetical protein